MPAIKQPTLVVWGRGDRLLPAQQADILKANLPNARVVLFDACGHVPQLERAADFNTTVLDFLANVNQAEAAPGQARPARPNA